MTGAAMYKMNVTDNVLSHWWVPETKVHDLGEDFEEMEIAALVASGDCFDMLASELDRVSCALPVDSLERLRLEHTIRTLLHLQYRYKITRKNPRD